MQNYFKNNRFAIYDLIFDVLVLVYAAFFNINAGRIVFFYWLDSCVMLVFLMLFFKYQKIITSNLEWIVSSIFLIFINMIFLSFVVALTRIQLNPDEVFEMESLLRPYFDVGPFLAISSLAYLNFHRRITSLMDRGIDVSFAVYYNSYLTMLSMPGILILAVVFAAILQNLTVGIILSFLVLRNSVDYWLIRKIHKAEEEFKSKLQNESE